MDILAQGKARAERHAGSGGFKGKKNAYECLDVRPGTSLGGCGSFIITIDRDEGVTPFMLKCGNCGGVAYSKFYRVQDCLVPTHEWYRPDSLDGIDPGYFEHLSQGGIILRPIDGGADTWQRPQDELAVVLMAAKGRAEHDAMQIEKQLLATEQTSRQVRRAAERKGKA